MPHRQVPEGADGGGAVQWCVMVGEGRSFGRTLEEVIVGWPLDVAHIERDKLATSGARNEERRGEERRGEERRGVLTRSKKSPLPV